MLMQGSRIFIFEQGSIWCSGPLISSVPFLLLLLEQVYQQQCKVAKFYVIIMHMSSSSNIMWFHSNVVVFIFRTF